jgi:hypothetical protein
MNLLSPENLGATPEQFFEMQRKARVVMAKRFAKSRDILNWGKFPSKFNLPFCHELHDHMVCWRGAERTNTEAPRNHAKTAIKCFLIPIFQALEEPETFNHYLNVQATGEKANSVNMAIRSEIELNRELWEIYGNQIGEKWNEGQFVLSNGTIFTAIGAGQSIRGINYNNKRPDYLIVDDLYNEEDINNPESTIKKNAWFWGSLYPARAKSKRCSIHVQGTAINNEDLLEQLKKNERWNSRSFKAIKDWDSKDVLWPELNTFESLEGDRKDMGSVIFFREMQNERRDETSSIVKSSWLSDWEYDPSELKFDGHFLLNRVLVGVDPSIGEKSENDFTGVALILECRYHDSSGLVYYIEELFNEHISLDSRVALLERLQKSRPHDRRIHQAYVEGIAGFKDFVAELVRRTNLPVREVDKVPDKITNLENKSKYFENRKVKISKRIDPALKDMLFYQLTTNHPRHDDLRDAVLLCLDDNSGIWAFV